MENTESGKSPTTWVMSIPDAMRPVARSKSVRPLTGQRRQNATNRLRQDDVFVGIERAQSETIGRFPLPPTNGDNPGTENLRCVGAFEQT